MSLNESGFFVFDIVFALVVFVAAIAIIREVWND